MKKIKKSVSIFLCILMVISGLSLSFVTAHAAISGTTAVTLSGSVTLSEITNYIMTLARRATSVSAAKDATFSGTSTADMFKTFTACKTVDLTNLNFSSIITNASGMFGKTSSSSTLTAVKLGNMTVDGTSNTSKMFYNCSGIASLDLSNLKTPGTSVDMFKGCSKLNTITISDDFSVVESMHLSNTEGDYKGWALESDPDTIVSGNGDYAVFSGAGTYVRTTADPAPGNYTVKWVNSDGTELEIDADVPTSEMPEYNGDDPVYQGKADGYEHAFIGWTPEIKAVSRDVTYTAQFRKYIWGWTETQDGYTAYLILFSLSNPDIISTVIGDDEEEYDRITYSVGHYGDKTVYNASTEYDGITYTDTKSVFEDGVGTRLIGHSLSLEGDIGVNFYMELSDSVIADKDKAYMHFAIPTGNITTEQNVLVKDAKTVTVNGKTYYVFKCNVAAKEMTSEIKAQIIDGYKSGTEYTYSVKEYADYLLGHIDDNESYTKAAPLVKAMLNYGAYAQVHFDKNPGTLANADLTDEEKILGDVTIDIDDPVVSELSEGTTFEGATLSLKSETTLSLYFKSDETLTFSCEGYDVETVTSGEYQIARIRGIKAKNIGDILKLDVNGVTVTYSPLNYCKNVLASSTATPDEKLTNVVKALYRYWQAANSYFN